MRVDAPDDSAGPAEWRAYAIQLQECVELGRDENRAGFQRLKIDGNINIIAMGGLFLTLAGGALTAIQWADRVEAKLADLPRIVADNQDQTGRLNRIDLNLEELHMLIQARAVDAGRGGGRR